MRWNNVLFFSFISAEVGAGEVPRDPPRLVVRGALVAGCCVFALPVGGAPVAPVGGAPVAPVGGAPVAPVGGEPVAAAVFPCDEGFLVWVNNLGVVFRGCVNKLGFFVGGLRVGNLDPPEPLVRLVRLVRLKNPSVPTKTTSNVNKINLLLQPLSINAQHFDFKLIEFASAVEFELFCELEGLKVR